MLIKFFWLRLARHTWGPRIGFRVTLRPNDVVFQPKSSIRTSLKRGRRYLNKWNRGKVGGREHPWWPREEGFGIVWMSDITKRVDTELPGRVVLLVLAEI